MSFIEKLFPLRHPCSDGTNSKQNDNATLPQTVVSTHPDIKGTLISSKTMTHQFEK
jgi:hypothetical protein